jgi:hypothetical protein
VRVEQPRRPLLGGDVAAEPFVREAGTFERIEKQE